MRPLQGLSQLMHENIPDEDRLHACTCDMDLDTQPSRAQHPACAPGDGKRAHDREASSHRTKRTKEVQRIAYAFARRLAAMAGGSARIQEPRRQSARSGLPLLRRAVAGRLSASGDPRPRARGEDLR